MEARLPRISEADRTPLVEALLGVIAAQVNENQKLEDKKRRLEDEKRQLEDENQKLEDERQKLEDKKQRLEDEKRRLEDENSRLRRRLEQYEPEIRYEGKHSKATSKPRSTSYSLGAENKRRHPHRRHKKSSGRQATEVKVAIAQRTEDVYPDGVYHADCRLVRERAVWRLEDGRAILIGYRIFAGPRGREGHIPGVTPRCEYGIEILVVLAFLVYVIGISLDKACSVLSFFCELPLHKSEADALLRQLAKHWDREFDTLCALIAHAAVVYMDETGWKVGDEHCSLWAFATRIHRVFLFGCPKDGKTLDEMLPPDVFDGIGVSDDAAAYQNRFRQAQKCWAHLLRKAIRLAIMYPRKKKYQRLLNDLLTLYADAKRAAADGRLGEAGRTRHVAELESRLAGLCVRYPDETTPDMRPDQRDFTNLINELARLLMAEELFTFVLVEGVEPTNNSLERILRNSALDRNAGRTNKTEAGAHRRSVIVSVLESLRANLEQFTLANVLEEVTRWMREGVSLFARQWQKIAGTKPVPELNTS